MTTILDPILHAVIALGLLAAYCTLWALGHQDQTLLGILAGQLGGLGVSNVALKAASTAPPSSPVAPQPVQTTTTPS